MEKSGHESYSDEDEPDLPPLLSEDEDSPTGIRHRYKSPSYESVKSAPRERYPQYEQVDAPTVGVESGRGEESGEKEQCLICYYDLEEQQYRAVVPCKCTHDSLCAVCAMRLRVFSEKPTCPTCKVDWKDLIFTKTKGKSYDEYILGSMVRDGEINVCFDTHNDREHFRRARSFLCSICENKKRLLKPFNSLKSLAEHVEKYHRQFFCFTCAEHQQVFPLELEYFPSKKALTHHINKGSSPNSKRGSSEPHVKCTFCQYTRFYGNDQLYQHLEEQHYSCFLCKRHGSSYYEKNIVQLEKHFRKNHFLCEFPKCLENQNFAVFESELGLNSHKLDVHYGELSMRERKALSRVDLQFGVAPIRAGGRGNSRRNGDYHEPEPEPQPHVHIHEDIKEAFPSLPGHRPHPHEIMPLPGSGHPNARRVNHFPALELSREEKEEIQEQTNRHRRWRDSGRKMPERKKLEAGEVPPFPEACPDEEKKQRNHQMVAALRKVLVTEQQYAKFRKYSTEFQQNKMSVKTYYKHFLNLFGGQKDKLGVILIQLVALLPDREKARQLYDEHAAIRKKPFRSRGNQHTLQQPHSNTPSPPQRRRSPQPQQKAKSQPKPKPKPQSKSQPPAKQWIKNVKKQTYSEAFPAPKPIKTPPKPVKSAPKPVRSTPTTGGKPAPQAIISRSGPSTRNPPPGFKRVAPPGLPPPGLPPPGFTKVNTSSKQVKSKSAEKASWSSQKRASSVKLVKSKRKKSAERKFGKFKDVKLQNDKEKEAILNQYSSSPTPETREQNEKPSREEIQKKIERLRNESQAESAGLGTTLEDLGIAQSLKEKKEKEAEKQRRKEERREKLLEKKEKEKAAAASNGTKRSSSRDTKKIPVSHDHTSDALRSLRSRSRYDTTDNSNPKKSKSKKSKNSALMFENDFPQLQNDNSHDADDYFANFNDSDSKKSVSVDEIIANIDAKILRTNFDGLRCVDEVRHRMNFLVLVCSFVADKLRLEYAKNPKPQKNSSIKKIPTPNSPDGKVLLRNVKEASKLVKHRDHLETALDSRNLGRLKDVRHKNVRALGELRTVSRGEVDFTALHGWIDNSLLDMNTYELYKVYKYLELVLLSYFHEQSKPVSHRSEMKFRSAVPLENPTLLPSSNNVASVDAAFNTPNGGKPSKRKSAKKKKKERTLLYFG